MPVRMRSLFKLLLVVFKCVQKPAPAYLCELAGTKHESKYGLHDDFLDLLHIPLSNNFLFLAYINDLVDRITCKIKLFADDTVLYTVVDDHEASADVLNYNTKQVEAWANQWIVNLNPAKAKTMTVSFKSTIGTVLPNYPLLFRNVPLEEAQTHKHLGIKMTSNLKWTNHVASIIKGVSKLSDVMQKLKYKLDRRTLENIYFTSVRPKLEYASIIWDDCIEGDILKLENVQLGFARIVTGAKRGTSHELLYDETSWPTLSSRRNNVKMKFMHGVVHGKAPDYLCNLISLTDDNDVACDFRTKENVKQFRTRTEKFRKSLFPDCIRKWNELPADLWKIVKLDDFMNEITIPLKSNNLYYGIKRKLGVIHSQFRMQYSNLKGDLHSLHVVDDPAFVCNSTCCFHSTAKGDLWCRYNY